MENAVWAKMERRQAWPARICSPVPEFMELAKKPKGDSLCVFFFGSSNYAWVKASNVEPYEENREFYLKKYKGKPLKEAVKLIDEYLSDPMKYEIYDGIPLIKTEDDYTNLDSNYLHDVDESLELDAPNTAVEKSKEKSTQKPKNKGKRRGSFEDLDDVPSKRPRPSPKDDLKIDSTSEFKPYVQNRPWRVPEALPNHRQGESRRTTTSGKTVGVLGSDIMSSRIVNNLLTSGHKVVIWNRDPSESKKFKGMGAGVAASIGEVVKQVDIIFSYLSDWLDLQELLFGNDGSISSNKDFRGKGYVQMRVLDAKTSQYVADVIESKNGRYLEAPMQESKIDAEVGTLIIISAGDRTLLEECQSYFKTVGKSSFYLGDVGNASKMHLGFQLIKGVTLGVLAESLALADRAGLQQEDVLEILQLTPLSSPHLIEMGRAIIEKKQEPDQSLTHKDLQLVLLLSEQTELGMPITVAAFNEALKSVKRNGYSSKDNSRSRRNPPEVSPNRPQGATVRTTTSKKTFGFVGIGNMGSRIVKNLLNSNHKVVILDLDPSKTKKLEEMGAKVAMTTCDVAAQSDIVFCCLSDASASEELLFGNDGLIPSNQDLKGKGYVVMRGLDDDTSQNMCEAIEEIGGRYMETQILGSHVDAEEGTLVILAAGDLTLFEECQSCFIAMGKSSFFFGDVGNALHMYLVLQSIKGVLLAGLAELLALVEKEEQQKDFLEVLEMTPLSSPYFIAVVKAIIERNYVLHQRLTHMQKDLELASSLSAQFELSMPITAAANQVFKSAKRLFSGFDASSVYLHLSK